MPIKVGIMIVKKIFMIVFITSRWMLFSSPIKKTRPRLTIRGKVIRIIKLLIAVNEMERARFPFKIRVITFVADPPAHAVININPTFTNGSRLVKLNNKNATNGRIKTWLIIPVIIGLGYLITFVKSLFSKDKPIPIIIIANDNGKIYVEKKSCMYTKLINNGKNIK